MARSKRSALTAHPCLASMRWCAAPCPWHPSWGPPAPHALAHAAPPTPAAHGPRLPPLPPPASVSGWLLSAAAGCGGHLQPLLAPDPPPGGHAQAGLLWHGGRAGVQGGGARVACRGARLWRRARRSSAPKRAALFARLQVPVSKALFSRVTGPGMVPPGLTAALEEPACAKAAGAKHGKGAAVQLSAAAGSAARAPARAAFDASYPWEKRAFTPLDFYAGEPHVGPGCLRGRWCWSPAHTHAPLHEAPHPRLPLSPNLQPSSSSPCSTRS